MKNIQELTKNTLFQKIAAPLRRRSPEATVGGLKQKQRSDLVK